MSENATVMTGPAPVNLPPELCPDSRRGLCARCRAVCHRYGPGGRPLCRQCRAGLPDPVKRPGPLGTPLLATV
ncbi:hypothetical protein [Streptomyces alfalfae]|uniref:hypothetical protein n=1 Tax=Streptomyces alfalfae TaxID=1642299 RepID=UPI002810CEE3|nr:hypothetical protein [Streptomyces alfalfae]